MPLEGGPADDAALEPGARQTQQRQQADALVGAPAGVDGLTALALAYLALPNLIFLFGWLRLPIALLLCSAMIYFIARVFRPWPAVWRSQHARSAVVLLVLTSCAWAAFGGGSHFMHANADWYIRDAVLGDLVNAEWPVHYLAADGTALILRSAIGYFLPLAVFGKLFGLAHLDLAVYAWTTFGVLIFLLMLPLPGRAGWRLAVALLLVVFFSGMDFLGQIIATESMPLFPLRLEWWVPMSYPSLTNQLLWAPNHCLPIWIATVVFLRHLNGAELFRVTVALLPLTLIWTPFAAMGLLPFAVLGAAKYQRRFGGQSLPWSSIVAAAAFSLPIALFLLLDTGNIESTLATVPPAAPVNYPLQAASLHLYALFVSCEFLFLTLVLAPHVRDSRAEFWLAVIVLLALPLIRFGPSNDLGLRLSTTPLLVLLVICVQTLLAPGRLAAPSSLWVACLFLLAGAHTAFNEFWRAATFHRSPADYHYTLADRQGGQAAAHYVGRLGTATLPNWMKPLPAPYSREK